ncbi:MAG: hypothetical protein U0559_01075 [Anaerolineae bacterium]
MKQKYTGVKLYLIGLTAGLFVFGWAAIARSDGASNSTAARPANVTQPANNRSFQTQTQRSVPFQPRLRTRSS